MSPESPSSSARPLPRLDDPSQLAYLPMLYLAWADGELSAAEMGAICAQVTAANGGTKTCRQELGAWLDPDRPPAADELQRLLREIRGAAAALAPVERRSLADLGLELAALGGHEVTTAERQALLEIEAALGIAGAEASRRVLSERRPSPAIASPAAAFDVEVLSRLLEGEHRELRQRVRELLSGDAFRYVDGLDTASYREQVLVWARQLAAEGIGALSYPPEHGGGGDLGAFIAAFETVATHDLSLLVKVGVQFGLFGGSILQLGTERHHRCFLRDVGSLDLPGCFAMTETGHGSNVQEIETLARYVAESEEFEIHTPHDAARKDYIGNAAAHGRLATVFAQLEVGDQAHGVHAFLVPIRDEKGEVCSGVRIEDCGDKLGLNGVDNGRIWFDRVRIPRHNLLDRFARVSAEGEYASEIASPGKRFFVMLGTLVGGRVSVALAGLGAAKSALTIAVRYGARRRQFGGAGQAETVLLDYPSHQRRLLPRLAATYALHFALRDLARDFAAASGEDRRQIEARAAGLKALATWHATDTIQSCREACGGQGYLAVNRFAALKADSDVFTTFEGDNTVLMQLVARSLLTGYRRQFGDMDLLALLRYLTGRAASAVSELNPVVTRRTDEAHLRSADFQLGAFRWRREDLLASLARRLKRRIDDGTDAFDAFVECQEHALATARAATECEILERFVAAIARCDDERLGATLTRLRELYALERVEWDRGWFLEQGYLEPVKAKAIRSLVDRLCGEVRDEAVALVDAFAVPDALLAAPIALATAAPQTT